MTVSHRKPSGGPSLPGSSSAGTTRFHCDVCSRDVTNTVRIRCASEKCHEYDLCVQCFTTGEATQAHKSNHPYKIIEVCQYPIFDGDWGADEELALIDGLEAYGLGNWADVASSLGRTKRDVEQHYLQTYILDDHFPLPNMKRKFEGVEERVNRKRQRIEEVNPLSTGIVGKPLVSNPACHEIAGYLPGRLDFDIEYENDAELSVKDLQFGFDDDLAENELKLLILDIYNSRLTVRADRKRVMFEHNLVDYRRNQAIEKRRSREERELVNKAKPFARLMPNRDFEDFVNGLLQEWRLRREIFQLQEWRKMGVTSIEAGDMYEREKSQRASMMRLSLATSVSIPVPITMKPKVVIDPADLPGKPYKRNPYPLDISHASDAHLLTPAEQTLCSQLCIYPKPYLAIKEALFRELMRNGGNLKRRQARDLLQVDVNKTVGFRFMIH